LTFPLILTEKLKRTSLLSSLKSQISKINGKWSYHTSKIILTS